MIRGNHEVAFISRITYTPVPCGGICSDDKSDVGREEIFAKESGQKSPNVGTYCFVNIRILGKVSVLQNPSMKSHSETGAKQGHDFSPMMSKQFFLLGNIQPGKSFGALNPNSVFADSDNLLDQDFPCLTLGGLRFEIRNIGACIDITEGSREQIC
ncbi:MAG: hypothetical protein AUF79_14395 [Crenarchaeota archaeon 13_1_20CM_2_51_8]|nr:MAG: hypothetical protein AUF79_14395 [Crenarchaeota archaeon 13_1_20CM_2_51_8]